MLKVALLPMLCGCVLLMDAPVDAQQPKVDCGKAETQMEMTYCAEQDLDAADKALNRQYQVSRKATKAWDAGVDADQKGADAALVAAQRAWVAYRDAQCASVGYQAHGGSMEPQLIYDCQAGLTRTRTTELKDLAEAMGE